MVGIFKVAAFHQHRLKRLNTQAVNFGARFISTGARL
jgi:hypothetical protein